MIAPPTYLAGETGGNFVLVAGDRTFDVAAISAALQDRGSTSVVLDPDLLDDFVGDADVLTDDFAPVDQLITS